MNAVISRKMWEKFPNLLGALNVTNSFVFFSRPLSFSADYLYPSCDQKCILKTPTFSCISPVPPLMGLTKAWREWKLMGCSTIQPLFHLTEVQVRSSLLPTDCKLWFYHVWWWSAVYSHQSRFKNYEKIRLSFFFFLFLPLGSFCCC